MVLVRPIARGLARAGVVRGTAVAAEEGKARLHGQTA